jgi:maltokinase
LQYLAVSANGRAAEADHCLADAGSCSQRGLLASGRAFVRCFATDGSASLAVRANCCKFGDWLPVSVLDIARLDLLVEQIPHGLFASQRWFRSKARPIAGLALADAAPLVAEPDAHDAALLIVRVSFADGDGSDDELYLLPVVFEPDVPGPSPADAWGGVAVRDAASGRMLREPRDGDGLWRRLAAATIAELTLPALHGSFAFHALPAFEELVPSAAAALAALDERTLGVEQSNSSVVLGERLLLKLYRQVEPGENPDLELPRFLSRVGFERVPAVAGYVRYLPARGEPSAALMLQAFVPGAIDGWRWLLDQLGGGDAGRVDAALAAVERIGEITAEMHAALAARPSAPAFPTRDAAPAELMAWAAGARGQLERATAAVPQLAGVAGAVQQRFAEIEAASGTRVTRIHGDYHLGQLLRDRNDFWVIDFEGEPARPLAERRAAQSPLKDVAGMLRSLDYAARTVERHERPSGFRAEGWTETAREALLRGYRSAGGAVDEPLVRAFELEKACYEVRYEANNRPDWVWLPLEALERLAAVDAK